VTKLNPSKYDLFINIAENAFLGKRFTYKKKEEICKTLLLAYAEQLGVCAFKAWTLSHSGDHALHLAHSFDA